MLDEGEVSKLQEDTQDERALKLAYPSLLSCMGQACQVNLDRHFHIVLKCQEKIFCFCFVLFLLLNVLSSEYPGFLAKVN